MDYDDHCTSLVLYVELSSSSVIPSHYHSGVILIAYTIKVTKYLRQRYKTVIVNGLKVFFTLELQHHYNAQATYLINDS